MKTIGLIGGMSWESSVVYYQVINRTVQQRLGGLHSARTLMYSVDFVEVAALQQAGNWAELEKMMIDAARRLEAGGADMVLICANTVHIVADAVEKSADIPLVHIGDAVGEAIKAAGFTKVGLLGTRYTMEMDFLKKRLTDRFGIETIIPDQDDRDCVHKIIYDELVKGQFKDDSRATYLEIIDKLTANGAEGIILGCTEIPLLVKPADTSVVLFDTTRLHAERAVEFALS
jgi:aspartate racemase